jgi:hypothetical protein
MDIYYLEFGVGAIPELPLPQISYPTKYSFYSLSTIN